MIDGYLKQTTELDDHAIHLLFAVNRWEKASVDSCRVGSFIRGKQDRITRLTRLSGPFSASPPFYDDMIQQEHTAGPR